MTNQQLLAEIREANLTYLTLSQSLIRQDKAQALSRLGISGKSAELIATLSPAQLLRLAATNMLLCRFRADDDTVWRLLTRYDPRAVDDATPRGHADLPTSGRFARALA